MCNISIPRLKFRHFHSSRALLQTGKFPAPQPDHGTGEESQEPGKQEHRLQAGTQLGGDPTSAPVGEHGTKPGTAEDQQRLGGGSDFRGSDSIHENADADVVKDHDDSNQ
jgi:hypothetical protein